MHTSMLSLSASQFLCACRVNQLQGSNSILRSNLDRVTRDKQRSLQQMPSQQAGLSGHTAAEAQKQVEALVKQLEFKTHEVSHLQLASVHKAGLHAYPCHKGCKYPYAEPCSMHCIACQRRSHPVKALQICLVVMHGNWRTVLFVQPILSESYKQQSPLPGERPHQVGLHPSCHDLCSGFQAEMAFSVLASIAVCTSGRARVVGE